MKKIISIVTIFCFVCSLSAKTIAEKKASIAEQGSDLNPETQKLLAYTNTSIKEQHKRLHELYDQVEALYQQDAPEESYQFVLREINEIRSAIRGIEDEWCRSVKNCGKTEGYALWHQPDTTIGQLVIDYGSSECVYLMTPDIAQTKIGVASNLPIPSSSWNEIMELILSQNGFGVKQLNPYLRQLYKIKDDRSQIRVITNDRKDLHLLPPTARAAFVLSPEPADTRRIWMFLERFTNPNSSTIQMVGGDIFIVCPVGELQDLLKLYDFVAANRGDKDYKVVSLRRVNADEMAKILAAIFEQFTPQKQVVDIKGKKQGAAEDISGLRVITLAHVAEAVFLVGTQEEIRKAEEIIREVESQVGGAREKVIHWYTARHSDPEDLAKVLAKIYALLVKTGGATDPKGASCAEQIDKVVAEFQAEENCTGCPIPPPCPGGGPYDCGYFLDDRYIVNEGGDSCKQRDPNLGRNNFIVDPKSNSIVMVVEADLLNQMKELIRKLDIPKKMVQIEVLLFEKRLKRENDFGLNLLKIGSNASDTHRQSACWNDGKEGRGIFEYILSQPKGLGGLPAFDLIYKFLMTQDDITINATPTVMALNQTKAKINVEEEISVNTGVFEIPTEGAVALKDSFARARYGIKIEITPTIHLPDDTKGCGFDETAYVTLDTDVIFETFDRKSHNRKQPDVTRRVICNHVRVADGESVILGGLRRKVTEDKKEMIPFIGELPGIGKLFSITEMEDHSTEMYIFITPRIIYNAEEDAIRLRTRDLCRRPGDIPSYLGHLVKARECEQSRMMTGAMDMLFGRERERIEIPCGEYDGRCRSCN